MANNHGAFLPDNVQQTASIIEFPVAQGTLPPRSHVLTRLNTDRSGRLVCADETEIEIPSLEIYAAR